MTVIPKAPETIEAPKAPEPPPSRLPKQFRCEVLSMTRQARAEDEAADSDPVFTVVLATETPAKKWWGEETLSCEPSAVNLSRAKLGIPYLLEHGSTYGNTIVPETRVGLLYNLRLENGQLLADSKFSRSQRGQDAMRDVEDGIIPYVSVGYIVERYKVTQKPDYAAGTIEKRTATRWTPVEGSLVAFPADHKAVSARSAEGDQFPIEFEAEEVAPTQTSTTETRAQQESQMDPKEAAAAAAASATATAPAPTGTVETRNAGGAPPDRNAEVARIMEVCAANNVSSADQIAYVQRGMRFEEVAVDILSKRATPTHAMPSAEQVTGASKRELRNYSFQRALRMAMEVKEGRTPKGLEWEVSESFAKSLPVSVQRRNGVIIPMRINDETDESRERQTRAMGTGVAGGGAELVHTQHGEFIDILRNKTLVMKYGAQVLTGLTGPIEWDRQTGDATVYFVGENPAAAVAASDLAFGQITSSPKTIQGKVVVPRQLMTVSSIDIEAKIRNSLAFGHAAAWDRNAIHGPGTDRAPLGIYNTPSVNSVAFGGNPTWDKLIDMQTAIDDSNALDGSLAYMTTPLVAGRCRKTVVTTNANVLGFLWNQRAGEGELAGYRAGSTKQVLRTLGAGSDHGLVFGDWSQLAICMWGGLEVIFDQVTAADSGQVKFITFQMGDSTVLRPEAFCVGTGVTA